MKTILGSKLSLRLQLQAQARFVHRFTGNHRPTWAIKIRPCGKHYPVQFRDDNDWLANTRFQVTNAGKLAALPCESCPTWPLNPELRTEGQENKFS